MQLCSTGFASERRIIGKVGQLGSIGRSSVESRKGAVALRHCQWPRFPSPLIKPDVRISRIRLSD